MLHIHCGLEVLRHGVLVALYRPVVGVNVCCWYHLHPWDVDLTLAALSVLRSRKGRQNNCKAVLRQGCSSTGTTRKRGICTCDKVCRGETGATSANTVPSGSTGTLLGDPQGCVYLTSKLLSCPEGSSCQGTLPQSSACL